MAKTKTVRALHFPVREAKNRFSELVRRAAKGEQITITLHGEPWASLSRAVDRQKPFRVDWRWLRSIRIDDSKTSTEILIRSERDERD